MEQGCAGRDRKVEAFPGDTGAGLGPNSIQLSSVVSMVCHTDIREGKHRHQEVKRHSVICK